MSPPSPNIIESFGLKGDPEPIAGGRGLCYLVGHAVLRPSDDEIQDQWISSLLGCLLQRPLTQYRLATPIPLSTQPGIFVSKGWTASSFVSGIASPTGRFIDRIKASRAFHADLAQLVREKPEMIGTRPNRWTKADKVTWGESRLHEVEGVNEAVFVHVKPLLDRLEQVWRPLPDGQQWQLIHGDLTGNILFTDDAETPPAIIDYTFYWRPAEYANAIIVADGLAWAGEGRELVEWFATDGIRTQLLVRAIYWRYLTFAINSDLDWIQRNLLKADYPGAVETVCKVAADQSP